MEVDLERERRMSRERLGEELDVVLDATPREHILGADRVRAAESFVRELRRQHLSTNAPLEEPPREDRPVWIKGIDRDFDRAVSNLSSLTGFREQDVHDWIVYGARPRLHRLLLGWRDTRDQLPDGTWLSHRSVTLTFNAPVTQAELVRVYRERIRPLWEPSDDELAITGPDVTDLDYHLLELVKRTPDSTWAERLDEWRASPMAGIKAATWKREQGSVTVEALRTRWHRIDADIRQSFISDTDEEDDG